MGTVRTEFFWLPGAPLSSPRMPRTTYSLGPRFLRARRLPTAWGLVEAWTSSLASARVTSLTPSLRSFSM